MRIPVSKAQPMVAICFGSRDSFVQQLIDELLRTCDGQFLISAGMVAGRKVWDDNKYAPWVGVKDEASMAELTAKMVEAGHFTLIERKQERKGLFRTSPVEIYEYKGQRVRIDTDGRQ